MPQGQDQPCSSRTTPTPHEGGSWAVPRVVAAVPLEQQQTGCRWHIVSMHHELGELETREQQRRPHLLEQLHPAESSPAKSQRTVSSESLGRASAAPAACSCWRVGWRTRRCASTLLKPRPEAGPSISPENSPSPAGITCTCENRFAVPGNRSLVTSVLPSTPSIAWAHAVGPAEAQRASGRKTADSSAQEMQSSLFPNPCSYGASHLHQRRVKGERRLTQRQDCIPHQLRLPEGGSSGLQLLVHQQRCQLVQRLRGSTTDVRVFGVMLARSDSAPVNTTS